ncbi:hypothetical protein Tco_0753560 [Tanacetum coccineum]
MRYIIYMGFPLALTVLPSILLLVVTIVIVTVIWVVIVVDVIVGAVIVVVIIRWQYTYWSSSFFNSVQFDPCWLVYSCLVGRMHSTKIRHHRSSHEVFSSWYSVPIGLSRICPNMVAACAIPEAVGVANTICNQCTEIKWQPESFKLVHADC